jgi:hypothetical protein
MGEPADTKIKFFTNGLYIQNSDVHGRGVFSERSFNKDDVLEVFPLTPMGFRTRYQGDFGVLTHGFIHDKCPCEECKRHGYVIYLGMGYSSGYNHQDEPNAEMIIDFASLSGTVRALKNIEKDSEIFIKYDNNHLFFADKVMLHE